MTKTTRMTSEERKKVLIKSAIKVFSKKNYRSARVAEIASVAGVTEPIVYKHFPSKKQLYLDVLDIILKKEIERLRKASLKAENPIEKLKIVAEYQYKLISNYREGLKLQFQAFSEIDDNEVQTIISNGYESSFVFIEELLTSGIEQGYFKPDTDTRLYSRIFMGHTVHLNAFYLTGVLEDDYPNQVFLDYLNTIVVDKHKDKIK